MAKKSKQAAQPTRLLVMRQLIAVQGKKVKSNEATYEVDGTVYPKSLTAGAIGNTLQYNGWVPVGYIEEIKEVKGTVCMIVNGENVVIRDESQFAIIELGDAEAEEAPAKTSKSKKSSKKSKSEEDEDEDEDDEDEDDVIDDEDDDEDDDDDRLDLDDDDDDEDDDDSDDEDEDDEDEDDEDDDDEDDLD